MEYNFREIEKKWQKNWEEIGVYKVSNDFSKPKYYVLDMFPYPSGAGLHVGHPLGYIASDIYARFKRLKGFNILHPMGYDAFGLPAEQYAIEHGVHPETSTKKNIETFEKQLNNIGFCYDWSRKVNTSDPHYYKWTQWIFLQLFHSYFNRKKQKAEHIDELIKIFEGEGNKNHLVPDARFEKRNPDFEMLDGIFSAQQWKNFDKKTKQDILMEYRLAYCGFGEVNWCEALGTVLANDEVVNGVSERGGFPVEKKVLRQWYLRITEYADRLLEGLQTVDFSEAMKEMQTNWIGKSEGAEIDFSLIPNPSPSGEGGRTSTYKTAIKEYWNVLKQYGRENRKNATLAEDMLWQRLRNNQLGEKVRRQHAIQGYIVDFAFLNSKLVIEIDGEYHNEKEQQIYDEARTKYLSEYDFKLIRFTNDEVEKNIEHVINKIKAELEEQKKLIIVQAPLSFGRGAGGEVVLKVYTTRPDTIMGVDFIVIAPEHDLVETITTLEQKQKVEEYVAYVKSRSDRERQAEKKITGCFTGAYAVNPFNETKQIPIYISEYVLAGYGTGAIMAVPCGDERDFKFAQHFNIPITNILGNKFDGTEANPTKDATLENSGFLTGLLMREAMEVVIQKLEEKGIGKRKVNYRMRDAAFSRQRYWGEPFPIVWKDGIAYPLDEKDLPLLLPEMKEIKPGKDGDGPLSNNKEWLESSSFGGIREASTMPGYAGSSWYFLRYMDPHNDKEFADRKATDYWNQVDLYIGGTEHAVGHLLYSRMWTKALYDLSFIGFDEPFKKLVNQGMIQGVSDMAIVQTSKNIGGKLQVDYTPNTWTNRTITLQDNLNKNRQVFYSYDLIEELEDNNINISTEYNFPIDCINNNQVNILEIIKQRPDLKEAVYICKGGFWLHGQWNNLDGTGRNTFYTKSEVEKMSKSKLNVVNPDDIIDKFGADTFRMYEMFLGPVEQSKPWDTKGIEGVHRFLKKLWRLFYDDTKGQVWNNETPNANDLKILHKTIQKIENDTERFSFNTAVSTFMICVNELHDAKCYKKSVLEKLLIMLTPYAPHVSEELWHGLGNEDSVLNAPFPAFEEKYIKESSKEYPVSINGKLRTSIAFPLDATEEHIHEVVLQNEIVKKWMEDKPLKKFIFVKNKMINVVV